MPRSTLAVFLPSLTSTDGMSVTASTGLEVIVNTTSLKFSSLVWSSNEKSTELMPLFLSV